MGTKVRNISEFTSNRNIKYSPAPVLKLANIIQALLLRNVGRLIGLIVMQVIYAIFLLISLLGNS